MSLGDNDNKNKTDAEDNNNNLNNNQLNNSSFADDDSESSSKTWIFTFIVVIILLSGLGSVAYYTYGQINNPNKVDKEVVFKINRGDSISTIANNLHDAHLIDNPLIFKYYGILKRVIPHIKAGEFAIPANQNMMQIYHVFQFGKTITYPFQIIEGTTVHENLVKLSKSDLWSGPTPQSWPEGTFFPDTWQFPKGTKRRTIIKTIYNAMVRYLTNQWEHRASKLPLKSKYDALILASIVEKEAANNEEMPIVASVFINRLKNHMRLQSDPTVMYGITHGKYKLTRQLKKSELKHKTPYNTYRVNYLPPTPIAVPSLKAIRAVIHPAKTNFFYFVVNPDTGAHVFATNLAEHNQNVQKYRKFQRKHKKK